MLTYKTEGYEFRFIQLTAEAIRDDRAVPTGYYASSLSVAVIAMPNHFSPADLIGDCKRELAISKFNGWAVSNLPISNISGLRIHAPNARELEVPDDAIVAITLRYRSQI